MRSMLSNGSAWYSLSICSLLLAAVHANFGVTGSQLVLSSTQSNGSWPRVTLVDLLSADEDFSLLVRLLQRSRLITTLNRLNGSTFFAPTNDAIRAAAKNTQTVWAQAMGKEPIDNIQAQLRATLLYHLLNYSLPYNMSHAPESVQMHETLLFPHPAAGTGPPGDPPDRDDDLFPDSLLAGEGQKLRIARTDKGAFVGTDARGEGGVKVVKADRNATNGNLVAINGVLELPRSIGDIVQSHPDLHELASLLPEDLLRDLTKRSHATLFAPSDRSWASLSKLEWQYLNSGFAQTDLQEILEDHLRSRPKQPGSIGYVERLIANASEGALKTDSGNAVIVTANEKGTVHINDSRIVEADILASNGVIHIIDSLLLPPNSLGLTVEKTLIALNATAFVSSMRDAKLSHLLQHHPNDGPAQTVLAFQDAAADADWVALPEPGTARLADTLQYHIVEGAWKPADLGHVQLLDTLLKPDSLKGAAQKLQVTRPDDFDREDRDDIVFGNANVVSGPYEVGNSVVYVIAQVLDLPGHALEVALSDLRLTAFTASVYAADAAIQLRQTAATTVFAPTNEAFEQLGLILGYLLLPAAKTELRQMLAYHAVDALLYLDGNSTEVTMHDTLEGSSVTVDRSNGTTQLYGPTVAGFPVNGDLRNASVLPGADTQITATGVLHVLDQVELPPDLSIDLVKLLRGSKGTTMLELLKLAKMEWVLRGEARPEPAPKDEADAAGRKRRRKKQKQEQKKLFNRFSYTILCPSDKAFSRLNMTYYRSDHDALRELLELHVIRSDPPGVGAINDPSRFPSRGRPIVLADAAAFSTLLSDRSKHGDVAFHSFGRDNFVVGVKDGRGASDSFASVVNFGRATPNFVTDDSKPDEAGIASPMMVFGGGVLALDAVLTPYHPNWFYQWGWIVLTVGLSVLAALLVGLLFWKLFAERKAHKAYHALEGEED